MKTYGIGLVVALGALLLAPRTLAQSDPKEIRTTARIGGQFQNGGFAQIEAKQLDDHTYAITVCGDAGLTDEQVMAGWVWMADKLAAGRPYDKQTKTGPYRYNGFTQTPGTPGSLLVGAKVSGRMILKAEGQSTTGPKDAPKPSPQPAQS